MSGASKVTEFDYIDKIEIHGSNGLGQAPKPAAFKEPEHPLSVPLSEEPAVKRQQTTQFNYNLL